MNGNGFDKVPPQNIEAEQSVLGAMILDRAAITTAMEILEPSDFYKEAHRKIFDLIITFYDKKIPVDLVTLTEELRKKNELESVGSPAYISSILQSVPTTANAEYYARIVKEKSTLRRLINSANTNNVSPCGLRYFEFTCNDFP